MASDAMQHSALSPNQDDGFTDRMLALQKFSLKTPRSASRRGLMVLAGGIVLLAVLLGIGVFAARSGSNTGPLTGIGLIFGLGASVFGFVQLVRALMAQTMTVSCPSCGAAHKLYRSVTCYVCTQCYRLLRFTPRANVQVRDLVNVRCPQCSTEWATTADDGRAVCHACGLPVEIKRGVATPVASDSNCLSCGTAVVRASCFCPKCGELIAEPEHPAQYSDSGSLMSFQLPPCTGNGMDSISSMANSGIGFLAHATWLQHSMREALVEGSTETLSPKDLVALLEVLQRGVASLNQALVSAPALSPAVRSMSAMYDCLFASVLKHTVDRERKRFRGSVTGSGTLIVVFGDLSRTLKALASVHSAMVTRQQGHTTEQSEFQPLESSSYPDWPMPQTSKAEGTPESFIRVANAEELLDWAERQLTSSTDVSTRRMPESALSLLPGRSGVQ